MLEWMSLKEILVKGYKQHSVCLFSHAKTFSNLPVSIYSIFSTFDVRTWHNQQNEKTDYEIKISSSQGSSTRLKIRLVQNRLRKLRWGLASRWKCTFFQIALTYTLYIYIDVKLWKSVFWELEPKLAIYLFVQVRYFVWLMKKFSYQRKLHGVAMAERS